MFGIGDSITTVSMCNPTDSKGWVGHLVDNITDATDNTEFGQELPLRYATGGYTITDVRNGIDAALASRNGTPEFVIPLIGANDIVEPYWPVVENDWKNDYRYVIEAIHTKWSSAKIYLGKSYREDEINKARMAILHGYIDDLVSEYEYCYVGLDSTTILDGHNPELHDGVHPNHAGCVALANAWLSILGF